MIVFWKFLNYNYGCFTVASISIFNQLLNFLLVNYYKKILIQTKLVFNHNSFQWPALQSHNTLDHA